MLLHNAKYKALEVAVSHYITDTRSIKAAIESSIRAYEESMNYQGYVWAKQEPK